MAKKNAAERQLQSKDAAARARKRIRPKSASSLSPMVFFCALGLPMVWFAWPRLQSLFSWAARPPALQHTACSESYPRVPGCTPSGRSCGHLVVDNFASAVEVEALRGISARAMALGGGAGGPTILDLQSGALSYGDKFVDVWSVFNATEGVQPFRRSELQVYADVVERVAALAEETFDVRGLQLTSPTFFSRISGDRKPKTAHDEYWHTQYAAGRLHPELAPDTFVPPRDRVAPLRADENAIPSSPSPPLPPTTAAATTTHLPFAIGERTPPPLSLLLLVHQHLCLVP
jgi:hypothetical protein